jgi:hypothetical protein
VLHFLQQLGEMGFGLVDIHRLGFGAMQGPGWAVPEPPPTHPNGAACVKERRQ